MKIEHDQWLTNIFSYDVSKVTEIGDHDIISVHNLFPASHRSSAFLYTKIPSSRVDHVTKLTAIGFYVVDVNVTLEREISESVMASCQNDPSINPALEIGDARPEDKTAILDIASSCFIHTRFHLDPLIPKKLANNVKREWVANYFTGGRGEQLLVARKEGRPVGFLAVLSVALNDKKIKVIDIMGVEKKYQREGVGKALVDFFVRTSGESCNRLRVGTQVANIPSLGLYQRCGFYVTKTEYLLHAHLLNGKVKL